MHHPDYKHLSDGGTSSIGMLESYDPVIDMATECHYSTDYWAMPYKNGSTPMKEMEGKYIEFDFF